MRVYYAHSVGIYDTPQEKRDLTTLQALGLEVVNPNNPADDAGYKTSGMAWFMRIVDSCSVLAFRANPDGSINAGVGAEIERARSLGIHVIELPCGIDRRTLTVDQTREFLRDSGAR